MKSMKHAKLKKGIGILPGHHPSYIDHVVPLCQILEIPLLVTDREIEALVERYYPPMSIVYAQPEDYDLDPYLKEYDLFVYVDFFRRASGSFQFQDYLSRKAVRSVMSLHGNPDKYWGMYWLEKLNDEDIILAYGPQLAELLKKKGISKKPVISGNYRLEFYHEHKEFFDHKLPFQKTKPILLYAPTWATLACHTPYQEQYTPFFDVYPTVFKTLSDRYQLIVKLHPHMIQMMPEKIEKMMQEYPEIHFLNDFPLIYPLLSQVDIYLGDYSSIGYDFLYYDRPLFFLETHGETALQAYGTRVSLNDLPHFAAQKLPCKNFYQHVFGPQKPLAQLKLEIENACRFARF